MGTLSFEEIGALLAKLALFGKQARDSIVKIKALPEKSVCAALVVLEVPPTSPIYTLGGIVDELTKDLET